MGAVMVTGGTGVIGAWVTRQLVEQGTKVVTYSRHLDPTLVKDILGRFDSMSGDVVDLPRLIQTIKQYKVDRIIHLSATLPEKAEANPLEGYRINAEGALNVLEAARLMDVKRVVCTSSKGVYDVTRGEYGHPTYKPMDEDYPRIPNTVYGTTKVLMENMGLDFNRIYGLDFVALRFPSPYGIGRLARHGIVAITSRIIESAMLDKPLDIPQGAEQKDDFIYLRDVANGIVLACFVEKVEHRIFNIGSGKGETLAHMIQILSKILGRKVPITIGPGVDYLKRTRTNRYSVFNIERARKELGFSPKYDLESGVRDYIETMRRLDIKPYIPPATSGKGY